MKTFNHRTLSAFILATLIAAPAGAMGGRSGAQALMAESRAHVTERPSQTETQMQAQIEALQKDVAELKAQQALTKSQATTR